MSECDLCHYEFADSDLYITNASQALCNKCMNTNEPKQEEGYILITAKDFDKYEPKLATDEFWLSASEVWIPCSGRFIHNFTYRRKINPAVVERCPTCDGRKHLGNTDYHCPVCGGTGTMRPHIKDKPANIGLENIIRNQSQIIGKLKSALTEISQQLDGRISRELAAKTLKEVE